jgi:NADH-quinone oxidoreductase subunit L
MLNYYLAIVLIPLAAAAVAGLAGKQIGRAGAHWVTILSVGISFALSCVVLKAMLLDGAPAENISVYTWAVTDGLRMEVGFLVDRLTRSSPSRC